MDLFRFLGITRSDDMKKLLWRECNRTSTEVEEARILGTAQIELTEDCHTDDVASMSLFVAHSCSSTLQGNQETIDVDKDQCHNDNVLCAYYEDATWDVENNCFSRDPELKERTPNYSSSKLENCSCFQITWEVDRSQNQRTLSHIATDTEGIRSGRMEVQFPYFHAVSQVKRNLSTMFCDSILEDIIKSP